MKKLFLLPVIMLITGISVKVSGSPINDPSGTLQKMWVDYGVTEGNRYGMMMHISFTAYDMKGVSAYLGAYIAYNNGAPGSYIIHKGKVDQYHTNTGQLSVGKDITPLYDASVYDDVQLFMPYDEFDLDPGSYDLTIDVQLLYKAGGTIAWLKQYDIEFTQNDRNRGATAPAIVIKDHPAPVTGPRASFDKMWVDYDVMNNGEKGMLLHLKFTAYEMKDMDAMAAVYFLYNNAKGGLLMDKNKKYNSAAGEVAVYKEVKPAYDPAVYDDLQIFVPYNELDLDPGTYELTMDVGLIHKEGGYISKLTYFNFHFTQDKN